MSNNIDDWLMISIFSCVNESIKGSLEERAVDYLVYFSIFLYLGDLKKFYCAAIITIFIEKQFDKNSPDEGGAQ